MEIRQFLQKTSDDILEWAINCFVSFVAENFGGKVSKDEDEEDYQFMGMSRTQLRQHAFEQLSFGANKPFCGTRSIQKLWLANAALDYLATSEQYKCTFDQQLWRFRILQIWSLILSEREQILKQRSDELIKSLDHLAAQSSTSDQIIEYFLEKVHFHIHYFEYSAAQTSFDKALKLSGIKKMELGGALGRRTHFQQKSLPQLLLKIELSDDALSSTSTNESKNFLPHNCQSGDETLMEKVIFDDADQNKKQELIPAQSACLLAMAFLHQFMNASTRQLGSEETLVYLEEIIRQESCWSLQTRALIERSVLEMTNPKRVERACAQLETICNESYDHDFRDCLLPFFFCSSPLPFWKMRKMHAKILLSLGCTSEALRIFENLELWEEVVQCYLGLRQPEKAEQIIRKLLTNENREPMYLCLLGDITENSDYYREAIRVSGDKCARAHSSLGLLLLRRKQFADSVEHYSRSVEIQPLQLGVWFNLGYAAMKAADYQNSVRAFHRCVSIEPGHFEAWNNLAASYIHLNQKNRAQKIIMEALKLNWEDRHVWENLLLISVDIHDYKQAIDAMERLLDMDQKSQLDELPLGMLATELIGSSECDPKLLRPLLSIFSRVHARQSLSPKLLRIYAELKRPKDEQSEDLTAWITYTQLLERAFQREYAQLLTPLEQNMCTKMLTDLLELADKLKCMWRIRKLDPEQIKSQLRLKIQPKISLIEREFGTNCGNSEEPQFREALKRAKQLLE